MYQNRRPPAGLQGAFLRSTLSLASGLGLLTCLYLACYLLKQGQDLVADANRRLTILCELGARVVLLRLDRVDLVGEVGAPDGEDRADEH